MSLTSPLSAATFFDYVRVASCFLKLATQRELASQGNGGLLDRNLAPSLRTADITTVTLTKEQKRAILPKIEWLEEYQETFYIYDTDGRYPASDLTGSTLGSSSVVLAGMITPNSVAFAGLPAGYVLTAGDLFAATAHTAANLALYSQDYSNAAWTKVLATVASTGLLAPDGTLTASKIAETATTGIHGVNQNISGLTSSIDHTFSAYVATFERTFVQLQFADKAGVSENVVFNLGTGAISSYSAGVDPTKAFIINVNGWYRCGFVHNVGSGVSTPKVSVVICFDAVTGSYAGTAGSGLRLWGAQVEEGAVQGRYSPTTSGAQSIAATEGIHRLCESVTANGSGITAAVNIAPPLRNVMGWRAANFAIPLCRMCIVPGSVQVEVVDPLFSRISFKAIENIPAP